MKIRSFLTVILVAGMICALAACGGSPLSGKYVITDVIDDPEGVTFEYMNEMYKDMGLDLTDYLYFEFLSGNRFMLVMFGEEEAKGTYTQAGNTLTLTTEGRSTTAVISGKKITWTYDSGGKLVFTKK